MSDDGQGPGGRTLRMGKKKDGPNWLMIAGGAVVMAVSVAFGRKKILNEGEKIKERGSNGGARTRASSPHHQDLDESGSVYMHETVHNGTPFWEKSESVVPSQAEFEFRSSKSKRPAPTNPSPQVSKFCRQLSHNSVCQSNKESVQSDAHNSAGSRAGLTARREMVHRLRQQIRSRDATIYDMQTQISDQDQMIAMHRNHSVDLQECVQAISTKLFETNLDVQRLHRELMTRRAQPIADLDEECIDIAVAEIKRQWVHPKDVQEIIHEARKLNEEVERLEREKEAKDNLAQAKSRQCELLSKKVSTLATELEQVKTASHGKQRLLEAKEQENLKLTNVLQELHHKIEIEARDNEWVRSNKLSRRTDSRSVTSSWKSNHNVDRPVTPTKYEDVSSTCLGVLDGNFLQAGNMRKPHGSVRSRNEIQQDSEASVAKAESRCVSDAHTKTCEVPADQDGRVEDHEDNGSIDESLILKFEHEIDQLASALALTSKVVSEKMQVASRILIDFQKHVDVRADAQPNRSKLETGPLERKGVDIAQVFSCLSEGMSAEQRQELRHELEQVAKQNDIERVMKELTKHQAKLAHLKSAVAKVTARSNAQNTGDNPSVLDIEQKLAVQDEIAKETSLIIQQLSTTFQLSSLHYPPIQEVWRTVKETSGNSIPAKVHQKLTDLRSSDENSRNAHQLQLQIRNGENSSHILERQDSASALQHLSSNRNISLDRRASFSMKLPEKPYQFQLGASDGSVSTSRPTRRGGQLGAGRASFRKPAPHYENAVGSKRQSNCVGETSVLSSHRGSFRPDSEGTSGFSFGLSARDRPLDNVRTPGTNCYAETAESDMQLLEAIVETAQPCEQGDRMSSPEPEPQTHMFSEQRFSVYNTSEPSVNPTFSKRFRSNSGSETSPAFNSLHSPAYDVDRYSPSGRFGSPQSPCFEVTNNETSSRRVPLFRSASSPLVASSNSRLDNTMELEKLFFSSDRECQEAARSTDGERVQVKRSNEENISAGATYNSNPNCSPRQGMNSTTRSPSPVGVSPFAARMAYREVRQPGSPVGSLRSFQIRSEGDHFDLEDEEDDEDAHWGGRNSAEDGHLFNKDLESLCHGVSNLDTQDGEKSMWESKEYSESGSCHPDDPLALLPSLPRRSTPQTNPTRDTRLERYADLPT